MEPPHGPQTKAHWKQVEPRLHEKLHAEQQYRSRQAVEALCRGTTVVLAGQRAAGKSTLLPYAAQLLNRKTPPVDLDAEIERHVGCSIGHLVARHGIGHLRVLEKEAFLKLPAASVVAVGGGFWSTWPELLQVKGCTVVEVPISFETYRERLLKDAKRPRLRPELTLEEELLQTYAERQALHEKLPHLSWVEFCLAAEAGLRPRRVVTLPPGAPPLAFAAEAKAKGADMLEIRTDLHGPSLDVAPLAKVLPLLLARRGHAVPTAWKPHACCIDIELGDLGKEEADLVSLHAPSPMLPHEAKALWQKVPPGLLCKHVEPVGELKTAPRLLETQKLLRALREEEQTTVLAMGELALPFRCLLSPLNSLDYVALSPAWQATWKNVPGQRLLADAVREARSPHRPGGPLHKRPLRKGIVGTRIAHARSPGIHPQPFDRIDVPEDADIKTLVETLRPFYAGFAITSPFKRALAENSPWPAVNTLVRTPCGWHKDNTDVAGAKATLKALGEKEVVVLGQGGVAIALKEAAKQLGVLLRFISAKEAQGPLQGAVVWTWPSHVEPPAGLRFEGARVALIAYGKPAWVLAEKISRLGGKPCMLGATWFVAQARGQRQLWKEAQ